MRIVDSGARSVLVCDCVPGAWLRGGGVGGGNFGDRWTKVWILNAHVTSSLSLYSFYYWDLICIVFIIQVDFGSD